LSARAEFTALDWAVVGGYILILAIAGWLSTRRQRNAEDYFLAGQSVPV
jgi:Na+/proline symporter